MSPTPATLDILPLLREVYPRVRKDKADSTAVDALLLHCGQVVQGMAGRGEKLTSKQALRLFAALDEGEPHTQPYTPTGASHLRRTILEACPPWTVRGGKVEGWGWEALEDISLKSDGPAMQALLSAPHAPRGVALEDARFDLHIPHWDPKQPGTDVRCNAIGLIMLHDAWRTTGAAAGQCLRALVDAGVDINAPLGVDLGTAVSHTQFPEALEHLIGLGGDLARTNDQGVPALATVFRQCHRTRATALVVVCVKHATSNPGVGEQLRQTWPAILQAWADQLTEGEERDAELVKFLHAANDLAETLGVPLGSNRPGQPNLFAYWARSLLSPTEHHSNRFYTLGQFPAWAKLTGAIKAKHAWSGEVEPGIPDGAWGLMVAALNKDYEKATFPRGQVDPFVASKGEAFWEGYGRLVERMGTSPGAWRSVPALQPAIPRRLFRDMMKSALLGYLASEEGDAPGDYTSGDARNLVNQSSKWLTRMISGQEVDAQMCNLALRAHMHRGMASPLAQEGFACMASRHGELMDVEAIGHTLARTRNQLHPATLAQLQAQLLEAHPHEAPAARSGPRL